MARLVASLLGAAALLAGCRARAPTDEERIRALFEGAARAAEEKRVGDAVADVSERFAGEGLDRRGVKQLVAAHVLRGTWIGLTLSGVTLAVEGDAARAVVDVVMWRTGKGTPLAAIVPEQATVHRFRCRLAREPDGWKVTAAAWRPISAQEAVEGPPPAADPDPM